ncbi:MAG TPA: ATP-binding protein, partial [Roseiflexaceae bacterium]|nr:ATP-binding protein [Roseiflexaceae bacterium]
MSIQPADLTRAPQLADRLTAARRRFFVGRAAELDLFRAWLAAKEPPFSALHIFGPGGVGKTTLLWEYARIAGEYGVPALLLDGRDLDVSPAGFLLALRLALGLDEGASPIDALARLQRCVLLIDTYESLAPLDGWLRETLLPRLPAGALAVIAGRNAPAPAWRAELGWRALTRVVSLRNLQPDESRAYLARLGVPEDRHQAALALTHGHPLALALIADVLAQAGPAAHLDLAQEPDIVRTLLDRFVRHAPSPAHRRALEVAAHARVTTEALLAEAVDAAEAPALFAWLRTLSFVEQGPQGIFPHDLARDVLDADLRWRNPQSYQELHRAVRSHVVRQIQASSGAARQLAFADLLYLHRHSPIMRPFYEWKVLGSAYGEPASADDEPRILEALRRFEGPESAAIARYWLRRMPHAFTVFRSADGSSPGFITELMLQEPAPEDTRSDPALARIWSFVERSGPPRPGEVIHIQRFWSGYESHQNDPALHNLVALTLGVTWLTHPRLAWSFTTVADPAYWQPMFSYLNFQRAEAADVVTDGRRYAFFAHDWRVEPPAVWLEVMEQRELATDLTPAQLEAAPPAPLVVLSQPEFAGAVRQALRDYARPAALAANPLLRSRLVAGRGGAESGVAALQQVLREAA